MSLTDDMPGLKERDVERLGPCAVCGKSLIGGGRLPLFYVVRISRAGFDLPAINRRVALGALLQSSALAQAMGPDEDIAKIINGPTEVAVHEECTEVGHLLRLMPEGE